ncbi:hypothetical protein JCM24511_09443 [Saitozyma sp. JCM 24511]|nr:hypothetical protein JCM24511_09443 [Saitozyma sp. JCM 24511]
MVGTLRASELSPSSSLTDHLPLPPPALAPHPHEGSSSAFPGHVPPVARPQWWSFDYAQLLPPTSPSTAPGHGHDLGPGDDGPRYYTSPPPLGSMKPGPPVMDNGPLPFPGGGRYCTASTRPQPTFSTPVLPMSPPYLFCSPAIDPRLLLADDSWGSTSMLTTTGPSAITPPQSDSRPGSSPKTMLDGTSIQPLVAGSPATRQMKWDDGPSLPDGSNDQPQSSGSVREVHRSPHTVGAGQAANRRNMLTWSSGGDLRRYEHEREAEDRVRGAKLKTRTKTRRQTEPAVLGGEELESRMETVLGSGSGLGLGLGFEPGLETRSDDDQLELEPELEAVQTVPTKGNKKARRQMQNRLAQRAFRARSKVQHQEVADHLKHLDTLCKTQSDRLKKLVALADRLQRENIQLKQGR